MPRRREVAKRRILPDPKFQDRLLAKFINDMMRKGEKAVAERVAYRALDLVQQRTNDDPIKTFKKALDNVKPVLEVKSRRVGGATYQVPVEVRQDRPRPWRCAGSSTTPRSAARRRWTRSSRASSWTPPTTAATR